ncbi:MAG: hypothetical protein KDB26_15260 [Microthrixaceae bacterium]|nr:hypothetical protein [Microthrixaceae bacterium]
MVHLPPPPQRPSMSSAAQPDPDLQYAAVTKFWKAVVGIVLSIAVVIAGWAAHMPIVLGVGIIAFALSCWTMYEGVQLNEQAESVQVESDVQDYPESPEPSERVSDLQQIFRDAEHRALRAPDNELPTAPRSVGGSVAGTEGFD